MTKNYFFSTIGQLRLCVAALLLTLCAAQVNAELLLNESFSYNVGNLYGQGGWVRYSTQTLDPIQVVNTPLTHTTYQPSASGKATKINSSEIQGQDLMKHFDGSGVAKKDNLYIAALCNVEKAGTNYFLTLCDSASAAFADGKAPTEKIRLLAIPGKSDTTFNFAIGKGNATTESDTTEYKLNTTYLVVIKYNFIIAPTDSASTKADDKMFLFVNPTTTEPNDTSAVATIDPSNGTNYGSDIAWRGTNCIQLKQGQTSSKTAPIVTLDAIRVATTWAELFTAGNTTGNPDPTLTASKSSIKFADVAFRGTTYTQTINVKGSNLTNDVTFTSNCANVTLSAASATKEQVSSAAGFDLTLTLTNAETACTDAKLTISSTGATSVNVAYAWTFIPTTDVENLAEFRTKGIIAINNETFETFRMKNPFVITYVDGKNTYAQDDEGGIRIADGYGIGVTINYEPGTEIAANSYGKAVGSFGTTFQPYGLTPSGNTVAVTPIDVTLAEIEANKAKYADRLVRITDVEFDQTTGTFGSTQVTITQNGTSAKMRVFASTTDIKGKDIPSKAHLVGISTSESTVVIAPRAWSDITPLNTTSLEQVSTTATCYAAEGKIFVLNNSEEVAIYNLVGTRVATLRSQTSINMPQGIYIVKMGKEVHKVIVK